MRKVQNHLAIEEEVFLTAWVCLTLYQDGCRDWVEPGNLPGESFPIDPGNCIFQCLLSFSVPSTSLLLTMHANQKRTEKAMACLRTSLLKVLEEEKWDSCIAAGLLHDNVSNLKVLADQEKTFIGVRISDFSYRKTSALTTTSSLKSFHKLRSICWYLVILIFFYECHTVSSLENWECL